MERIPMTMAGHQALEDELQHLKTVERHAVIKMIAEARAHGDLSENAEYHAAKDRQSFIEGRMMDLEDKISRAQIIDLDGPLLHASDRTPGIEYRNGVMQVPPRELWG